MTAPRYDPAAEARGIAPDLLLRVIRGYGYTEAMFTEDLARALASAYRAGAEEALTMAEAAVAKVFGCVTDKDQWHGCNGACLEVRALRPPTPRDAP